MNGPTFSLTDFVEHMRIANPFDDNRVTQVDSLLTDIPQINSHAFEQLKLHAEKTARSDKARGVVVSGSPGIGKSHLLARFGQWAREEKYPFIYLLNLQAGPQDILRTILRATISILSRDFSRTPQQSRLYKIISMAVRQAIAVYAPQETLNLAQCRRVYDRMLRDQNRSGEIYRVLWCLFEDVQRRSMKLPKTGLAPLALKLLSGDSLDSEQAALLRLDQANTDETGLALTMEEMKGVLKVLCEFSAYRNRSFILCFDQVDTLSEDQVQTCSATVHALLDLCPGLLVITSGVDETFLRWTSRGLVSKASWDDRIRQFPVLLSGIDANAARQVILRRVETSCRLFETIPEIASSREADPFFPVGRPAVDAMLLDSDGSDRNDLRPRDVISRAGLAWDRQLRNLQSLGVQAWIQSRQAGCLDMPAPPESLNAGNGTSSKDASLGIDEIIERRIEQHRKARDERPEELPVDAGNLSGLLVNTLRACSSSSRPARDSNQLRIIGCNLADEAELPKPPFQFMVEQLNPLSGVRRRVGVTIAEHTSGIHATNMLKRVLNHFEDQDCVDQAILVTDERSPLNLAASGRERLKELLAMGDQFCTEPLTFDQYVALDALESVVGLARAGDLTRISSDGTTTEISEQEVRESHHRKNRYQSLPLLQLLCGLDTPGDVTITEPGSA